MVVLFSRVYFMYHKIQREPASVIRSLHLCYVVKLIISVYIGRLGIVYNYLTIQKLLIELISLKLKFLNLSIIQLELSLTCYVIL